MDRFDDNALLYRGVYAFVTTANVVAYVGSSCKGLQALSENHYKYNNSYFRRSLHTDEQLADGRFVWIVKPALRTRLEVESIEREYIKHYNSPYNIDKDPVESSIKYGRLSASNT